MHKNGEFAKKIHPVSLLFYNFREDRAVCVSLLKLNLA